MFLQKLTFIMQINENLVYLFCKFGIRTLTFN